MKRCTSLALILALLLSLFAGLELKADATGYLYNTGVRGEVCTSLSSYATAYYTGSYTYDNLSTKTGSSLRSALYSLVNTNKKSFVYADLKTYLPYTDADYSNSSNLILFYCSRSVSSAWDNGTTWNREHAWPDSLGGSALEGDLHSMRPTDPRLNTCRGNSLYGEDHTGKVATASDLNGNVIGGYYGGNFEPLDNAKGDCARIILYDYVAQTSVNTIDTVFESVDILLKWCALDPVDEFEMSRNDSAQSIQNNRNPFVDYPELAWLLMGRQIPSDLVSPSGGTGTSYTVTASTNNSSYGTVSVSGHTITAMPKEGYYASGYTVLSGTATVTQNGNIFTVSPQSNCSIRINFAKKTTVTVSFNTGASAITTYAGEAITLPEGATVSGYSFVGWTENNLSATTQRPSYYAAGQAYTPNGNVTLYALYSYIEGGQGTGWHLASQDSQLYSGASLVLACNAKGTVAGTLNNTYLTSVAQSFSTDLTQIETMASEAMIFTLDGQAGAWTLRNPDGQLLGATAVKKLAWDNGTTTWTISISDGSATIASTNSSCGRFLYNSSSPRFTTYESNPSTSMLMPQIYINDGGVLYYTTELNQCSHSSLSFTAAKAATCTENGSVAYYTCNSCGNFFADAQAQTALSASQIVISALGHEAGKYASNSEFHWQVCTRCGLQCTDSQTHTWDEGTVTLAPTETETGITTYTCTACKSTYTESIPALGAKLTISFCVPQGIAAVESLYGYAGESVTLPQAGTIEGYTFVGWTAQSVSATTQVPNYYAGGQSYSISENVTLYALYRYTEGGTEEGWTLVTQESQLYSGASLVLASNYNSKVASTMNTTYLSAVDQSFSADLSTIESVASDALILILGGESGAWTLCNLNGQLLGCTVLKTVAWDAGTTTWAISFSDGTATIAPTEDGLGRLMYNSSYPRFTTYTSNAGTYMRMPQLYLNTGGVTYYTTELNQCDHATLRFTEAVAATCTKEGTIAYYTCANCGRLFADAQAQTALTASQLVLSPLGHEAGGYASNGEVHWQTCTRCGVQCTDIQSHTWDEGAVSLAPTETEQGLRTYTCTTCKATYTDTIPALGAKIRVRFSVPEGVELVTSLYGYAGDSVTLPTISGTPGEKYTFMGWTTQIVDNSTSAGSYYKAGQSLVLSEDISLKALFSYSASGGTVTWNRIESTTSLKAGSQVVIANSSNGVVAGAMTNQYLASVSATFSSDKKQITTMPSSALILTLGGKTGAWTFTNTSGKLLGATAAKKLAWGSGTTKWTISISSGTATITNGTSSYGVLMYNWLNPRFTTYTSTLFLNSPELYVRTGGTITYYNTEFAVEVVEPEDPVGPIVDENIVIYHTLNLTSDISITYAVPTSLLADYDSYELECVLPVYEGNTLTDSRTVTVEPVLNGNYYYFVLTGITAMKMNDCITATLHMSKGTTAYLSNSDEYSVATYAYAQLNSTSASEKLKALCANLLRYGAAAQTYKGYRTDSLVDSAMTDAHKAYLTDLDTVTFGNHNQNIADLEAPTVLWVGKTLLLDSKVTLRYVVNTANYTGNIEDLSLRISYTNYKGEEKTATVTGAKAYGTTANRYSFDFDGLLAAELRCVLKAAVYAGDTQLSGTMEYSVDSYGSTTTGTLNELCKSLLAYSDVALAYFN